MSNGKRLEERRINKGRSFLRTIILAKDLALNDCKHLTTAPCGSGYRTVGAKEGNTVVVGICERALVHAGYIRWRAEITQQ